MVVKRFANHQKNVEDFATVATRAVMRSHTLGRYRLSSREGSDSHTKNTEIPEDQPDADSQPAQSGQLQSRSSYLSGWNAAALKVHTKSPSTILKVFCEEQAGNMLKAWFFYFDDDRNGYLTREEFRSALADLHFPFAASFDGIWEDCMNKVTKAISLWDWDAQGAVLWHHFREFCGRAFDGPEDMLKKLRRAAKAARCDSSVRSEAAGVTESEFEAGLDALGWEHGSQELLWICIVPTDEDSIRVSHLGWIKDAVRRHRVKIEAQEWARDKAAIKMAAKAKSEVCYAHFKKFLGKKFKDMYSAWRSTLDVDGNMTAIKATLFKACRELDWRGDVRALWRRLDYDSSGVTNFEELDGKDARKMAQFKAWAEARLGHRPAERLWRILDTQKRQKVHFDHFAELCEREGCACPAREIASMLDWENKLHLRREDLDVLDIWRPPQWLVASPDEAAAKQLTKHLERRHGSLLKAWQAMDPDGSNCCSWHEFQQSARNARFNGNIAGAWLALDTDLGGSISFKELAPNATGEMMRFRTWAHREFGSVESAVVKALFPDTSTPRQSARRASQFNMCGANPNNTSGPVVSISTFAKTLQNNGFQGNYQRLWQSFNQSGEKTFAVRNMIFLDQWEDSSEEHQEPHDMGMSFRKGPARFAEPANSDTPGPGEYRLPSSFGASRRTAVARNRGGSVFSYCSGRENMSWMANPDTESIGPGHYFEDAPPPCRRWSILVERRDEDDMDYEEGMNDMGLDMRQADRSHLKVFDVKPGLIQAYNEQNPFSSVGINDLIVSVNGVAGDSDKMLRAMQNDDAVELTLERLLASPHGNKGAFSFGHHQRVTKISKDEVVDSGAPGPGSYTSRTAFKTPPCVLNARRNLWLRLKEQDHHLQRSDNRSCFGSPKTAPARCGTPVGWSRSGTAMSGMSVDRPGWSRAGTAMSGMSVDRPGWSRAGTAPPGVSVDRPGWSRAGTAMSSASVDRPHSVASTTPRGAKTPR